MNPHVAPEGLHDYVHGFLKNGPRDSIRRHVASCGDCRTAVDAIESEREAVRQAMDDDESPAAGDVAALKRKLRTAAGGARPRRIRLTWVPLGVAAAALVGILALVFVRTPGDAGPAPAQAGAREPVIARMKKILKEGSPRLQEFAGLALITCGKDGIAELKRIDPKLAKKLIDDGTDEELPPEILAKFGMVMEMAFDETKAGDIASYLADFGGLNIILEPAIAEKVVTLKEKGALRTILDALAKKVDGRWYVKGNFIVIGAAIAPRGNGDLALVRPPVTAANAKAAQAAMTLLASDELAQRERAAAELRALGLAAEGSLWKGIESDDADVRGHCEILLREVYALPDGSTIAGNPSDALRGQLNTLSITLSVDGAPLATVMNLVHEMSGLGYAILDGADEPLTIAVNNVSPETFLQLVFPRGKLVAVPLGNLVFVVNRDRASRWPPDPRRPVWARHDQVAAIETALDKVAAGKDADFRPFGAAGVAALRHAARTAGRAFAEKADQLGRSDSGEVAADFGGEALRKLLDAKAPLQFQRTPIGEMVKFLGDLTGLKIDVSGDDAALKMDIVGKGLCPRDLLSVIQFATERRFAMDGKNIVLQAKK